MKRDLRIILNDFAAITQTDIEFGDGLDRIDELCDEVNKLDEPELAFPSFFDIMERFPTADLGSPGALVHTMEQHVGSYEHLVEDSVRRVPSYLSVWMVNRILNTPSADRDRWLSVLRSVETNPSASDEIREEARSFLEHQDIS